MRHSHRLRVFFDLLAVWFLHHFATRGGYFERRDLCFLLLLFTCISKLFLHFLHSIIYFLLLGRIKLSEESIQALWS